MRRVFVLMVLVAVGCTARVTKNAAPVPVTGRVTMAGKAVSGVMVHFLAMSEGAAQVSMPVNDGQFQGNIRSGTYTYFFTPSSSGEFTGEIPKKYAEGSMDRQIDVGAGSTLELAID